MERDDFKEKIDLRNFRKSGFLNSQEKKTHENWEASKDWFSMI